MCWRKSVPFFSQYTTVCFFDWDFVVVAVCLGGGRGGGTWRVIFREWNLYLPVEDLCPPSSTKHCQSLPGSTHGGCTLTFIYVSTTSEKKQPLSHAGAPSHPCNAEAADRKGQEPRLLSLMTTMTKHTTPRAPLLVC